jgi:hypothetical protein
MSQPKKELTFDPPDDGRGRLAEFYSPEQPRVPAGYPAGGQWTDVGGDENGRGGFPVRVEGSHVVQGHPSLDGKRVEPSRRAELKGSRQATHDEWSKQARYHGVRPDDLHQLAAEFMAHDRASVDDRTAALREAREGLKEFGGQYKTIGLRAARGAAGGDAKNIKGIDQVAETLARRYPHLFAGDEHEHVTDRLFDMLAAGNPKTRETEQAYQQAMDTLNEQRAQRRQEMRSSVRRGDSYEGRSSRKASAVDDVPFSDDGRGRLVDVYAPERR